MAAYGALVSTAIAVLAGANTVLEFALIILTFFVSSLLFTAVSKLIDPNGIATSRRVMALLFAADVPWIFCLAVGQFATRVVGKPGALDNTLVFGAFLATGTCFVISNVVFFSSASIALLTSAFQPAGFIASLSFTGVLRQPSAYSVILGIAAFATLSSFLIILMRLKTKRGYSAVSTFRSFMKTWVLGRPEDLERMISDYSEEREISTKIMKFKQKDEELFIILPGVHPGPFYPVGSYNLPGLIYHAFNGGVLTLHRPGGHEMNIATSAETRTYVDQILDQARAIPTDDQAQLRGPTHATVGNASASATAFGEDLLLTISFAPAGSEDLDTDVETKLSASGKAEGLGVSVVDAHNSIRPSREEVDLTSPEWHELFFDVSHTAPSSFRIGYSNSNDLGFEHGEDLTDGGIGILLIEAEGRRWVLVLADANNAEPSVKGTVQSALKASGFDLVELCTTDSHNLAAKGLAITRGYYALGESTSPDLLAETIVKLAAIADSRKADCEYGSEVFRSKTRVFGKDTLTEIEGLTRRSTRYARSFSRIALGVILLLLVITILL